MRSPAAFLTLFVLVASTACDEVGPSSMPACDRRRCSDACLDLAGPICDVLEASCQERIFAAAQCVRGTDGTVPEVRVLTEEEYRAELAAAQEIDAGAALDAGKGDAGSSDAGADAGDPPADESPYYRGLTLLGLYTPKPSVDALEYLGGYYQSSTRSITLISEGQAQDSESSQVTLAHEFIHALQDQQVGLSELARASGRSTDSDLALGCLVEGEARLYEELAWVLLQGLSVDLDYWYSNIDWRAKYSRDAVIQNESPYNQLWLLRYSTGARFLLDAWLDGGNQAVRKIFDAPPNNTLYWMLGYAESQRRTEPLLRSLSCVLAQPPEGYDQVNWDTLGAFSLYAFLSQNIAASGPTPSAQAWELAKAWRQDALAVFKDEEGKVAVSWRLRLVDEIAAKEIEQLLGNSPLELRVIRHGDELELWAAEQADLKDFAGTDPAHCYVEK